MLFLYGTDLRFKVIQADNRQRVGQFEFSSSSEADVEKWAQLLKTLRTLRPLIDDEQTCSDFIDWAPTVARYSFQSGRVLLAKNVKSSNA